MKNGEDVWYINDQLNTKNKTREDSKMITVYFETEGKYAEEIAVFYESEIYMACLPALEALAEKRGYIVTESVTHE